MYTLQEIKPLLSIITCFSRHVINQYEYVFADSAFWNGDKKQILIKCRGAKNYTHQAL